MSENRTKRARPEPPHTPSTETAPAALLSKTPIPVRVGSAPVPETAAPAEIAAAMPEAAATVDAAVTAEIAATAQAAATAEAVASTGEDWFAFGQEALGAFSESQLAIARGLQEFTFELSGLARSGIAAAADTATAMLGARTLADALEVQAGFARRSVDAAIDGSTKLSEIGARVTTEASRPLLSRFAEPWNFARLG